MWASAFVALRVLTGATVTEALAELPEAERPRVERLAAGLAKADRTARARALAEPLHEVARALEEVTLR